MQLTLCVSSSQQVPNIFLLQGWGTSVVLGDVFGRREYPVVFGKFRKVFFDVLKRSHPDIRQTQQDEPVGQSGDDGVDETEPGNSDGEDEALERHREDQAALL
jgi:hypothetical protein